MPTRREPATPTMDPGTDPDLAIPGPMFSSPPQHPGPGNPDPLTTATDLPEGKAGDSGSSARPALTPTELGGLVKSKGKAYAKIAKSALHALGGFINMTIQVDDDDDAFLPDEDDDDTIPPPLGRLAARHLKIGANAEDMSDYEDIGIALVGLIAWALKGITEHLTARRERGPKGRRKGHLRVYDGSGEAGGEPGQEDPA